MLYIASYLFFITVIFLYLNKLGLHTTGQILHPVFFSIYFKFFISCFSSVIVLNSEEFTTILSSSDYGITAQTLVLGSLLLIVCALLFFVILFFFRGVYGRLYLNYLYEGKSFSKIKRFMSTLLMLQFFWLFFMVLSGDAKPLLYLISGDVVQANLYKAMIIRGELGSKMPVISYIPKYFFVFTPFFIILACENYREKLLNLFTVGSLLFTSLYFLMSGHKAPIFLFLMFLFLMTSRHYKIRLHIHIPAFVILLSFSLFLYLYSFGFLTSEENINYGISQFLERVFVSQSQGLFYILEYISPDFKYAASWFPFSSVFFDSVTTADSEIVKILFPGSLTYVNMNTIFIAEAFSVFGLFSALASIFYVWIIIFIISYVFRDLTKKSPVFFSSMCYAFFFNLPLSQNFAFFIFPKELIVVSLFFVLLYYYYKHLTKSNI